MWCCSCQQDVPAARGTASPAKCPRCSTLLAMRPETSSAIASIDCGLELDAFSRATRPLPAIRDRLASGACSSDLRRLERMLRPTRAGDSHIQSAWRLDVAPCVESREVAGELEVTTTHLQTYPRTRRQSPAWGVTLLLATGGSALISGLLLLVAANLLLHPAAWRWGFAVTAAGETVLLAGMALMTIRLWRNSRRLNSQLDAVDRRLVEVQSTIARTPPSITNSTIRGALRRLDRTPLAA